MTAFDPYVVLRVAREASADQIRAAYRLLSKTLHPDTGGSKEAFSFLGAAKNILLDPERRARYDATGAVNETPLGQQEIDAMQYIAQVLNDFIEKIEAPERVDLVDLLKQQISHDLAATAAKVAQATNREKKLARLQGRFTTKKGANLLDQQLAFMRRMAAEKVTEVQRAEATLKLAYDKVNNQGFTVEAAPYQAAGQRLDQQTYGSFFGNTGTKT